MCQRPRKSGPQRYRKYTSCHSVCVLCMASSYKYDCSEVYISKKIKLLWKTKFAMASDSKFYSHCEANHSIIRRYDHSLVRQYGKQICLLHKFNKLFEYRRHRTLLKSKLTRSLVTAFHRWLWKRIRSNSISLFHFSSKFSIKELFTPAFFSSFIINIKVNYVKSKSLLIHTIVSATIICLIFLFTNPASRGIRF